MITWVVGSGGLLGSALVRQLGTTFSAHPVPWTDPQRAAEHLQSEAARFASEINGGSWSIIWAAGAATTSSTAQACESELVSLRGLLEGITRHLTGTNGGFFLTSSAGGVYAGSSKPPFARDTDPCPLSSYGQLKLAQEHLAREMLAGVAPVTVGRVSNLYGPGQNLDKLQGLISGLAQAAVTRQPINIFVPLDTIRDYIFTDDAAKSILAITTKAPSRTIALPATHVIASGQAATVGYLLQTMNNVAKRHIPVALGSHASASAQSPDLRLQPTVALPGQMPLPAGMNLVYQDIMRRMQQPQVR